MTRNGVFLFLFTLLHLLSLFAPSHSGFHSDELLVDDDELVLDGVQPQPQSQQRSSIPKPDQTATPSPTPRRKSAESDSDSKIQFTLEHAFGDSDFVPAGTFSARLKTSAHGGQTLTKLRFSRNDLTDTEKEIFKNLLEVDDFYKIRLPSNVLSPPGKDFVVSSVKARCLPRETLDEHFVIQTEGVNILAVNYGAPGACSYPRQMKLPSKWLFNSYTVLKNTEQAPRTPVFIQDVVGGEEGEGEAVQPPERTWWAKYWMYLIPLGLIVMNAMTQAMNAPEEQQSAGQPGGAQTAAVPRGPSSAARRR